MIWSYLIHLGTNMWGDRYGHPSQEDFGDADFYRELPVYQEKLLCDRRVWNETVDFCGKCGINTILIDLGEGVRYDSHPELAIPGSWTKRELKAELDRMRQLGMTPVPKLNFSCCHDAWLGEYRLMRCTDTYYKVTRELIEEVCELFGKPALFHIGMDEETYNHQRDMGIATVRNEELWWHDFYALQENCERMGARAWCWSDYYWEHPDIFAKRMPKEVLQSNWYYDAVRKKGADGKYPQSAYQAYVDLDKLGYDQVPTASEWGYVHNIEQTVLLGLTEKLEHLQGFMAAPWLFCTERAEYALKDNAHRLGLCRRTYESKF